MMLPAFPTNTRELIEQMINYDGRDVTIYTVETVSGCALCNLDPFSDTSTDSYCPSCSGLYWIPTYSGWTTTAHVTWGRSEDKAWETGGMIDNGECSVKIMHSQEAEDLVYNAAFIVVDGREMNVQPGIILRGVPQVNRIIVNLREKEK